MPAPMIDTFETFLSLLIDLNLNFFLFDFIVLIVLRKSALLIVNVKSVVFPSGEIF